MKWLDEPGSVKEMNSKLEKVIDLFFWLSAAVILAAVIYMINGEINE